MKRLVALLVIALVCYGQLPKPGGSSGGGAAAASSAPFFDHQGPLAGVNVDATDKTLFSTANVPALAAGACYRIEWMIDSSGTTTTHKMYVDSTVVFTPGNIGYGVAFEVLYCNDSGTKATQHVWYVNAWGAPGGSGAFSTANGARTALAVGSGGSDTWAKAATAIDWSVAHTIKLTSTGVGGGSSTPIFWHIVQE